MRSRELAVVTGASSGIGRELARQFASHGYDLLITADTARINDVAEQLRGTVSVTAIESDLSTREGVLELIAAVEGYGRPIAALCLNAGVGVYGDFARETSLEEELKLIRLNIEATVHLAKVFARQMVSRHEGKILFTSSVAATAPGPLYAVYAASKAFIQSFAEALRNELSDAGVSVTSLMPGPTDTEFFTRADMEDSKAAQGKKDDPALVAKQGFEALMRGDDHVVGGSFRNKVQAALGRLTPDTVKAGMQRAQIEPTNSNDEH